MTLKVFDTMRPTSDLHKKIFDHQIYFEKCFSVFRFFLRVFRCSKIGFDVSSWRKSVFQVLFVSLVFFGSVKLMIFCIFKEVFFNIERGADLGSSRLV